VSPDATGPPAFSPAAPFTSRPAPDRHAAWLAQLTRELARIADATELARHTCRSIGEHLDVHRVYFAELNASNSSIDVAVDWVREPGSTIVGSYRLTDFGAPEFLTGLRSGRLGIDDVAVHPLTRDRRAVFDALHMRAIALAASAREGHDPVYLIAHERAPREWREDELALLEDVIAREWPLVDLARTEQALSDSEMSRELALSAARLGTYQIDLQTRTVTWNAAQHHIAGTDPASYRPSVDSLWTHIHPDDRARLRALVDRALATGGSYEVDFRVVTPGGEVRWCIGGTAVTLDTAGRPVRMSGVTFDLTDRKEAEQALATARDAAESANRLKDQFLAMLSHELRTPLNAILGYARMLRTNALPPEKQARALEIIERNADVQHQLVEDLLDISRIATGKVRLLVGPLLVVDPLRAALEAVRPAADARHIAMTVDAVGVGLVRGDAGRLQQLFWNLLSNAVKFTGEGGHVTVTLREQDGTVHVQVQDTGKGISNQFLPYVFEPFLQADGRFSREHGGLGLGLAICKQLVELHGGTITAASEGAGQGACFTVQLPLANE
jgi:PAS domain S-box-containing protein